MIEDEIITKNQQGFSVLRTDSVSKEVGRESTRTGHQPFKVKVSRANLVILDENLYGAGHGIDRRRAKNREQWEKAFPQAPAAGTGLFGSDLELRGTTRQSSWLVTPRNVGCL